MSKYCPKCKHNFSDAFDECVYCGEELLEGTIEIEVEVSQTEKPIYEMTDKEILEKYADYRKNIEEQIGHALSDNEFLKGLKEARRDSLCRRAEEYARGSEESSARYIPKCPTCQSPDIKKISTMEKAESVFWFGMLSRKARKQWHCNNCGSEW